MDIFAVRGFPSSWADRSRAEWQAWFNHVIDALRSENEHGSIIAAMRLLTHGVKDLRRRNSPKANTSTGSVNTIFVQGEQTIVVSPSGGRAAHSASICASLQDLAGVHHPGNRTSVRGTGGRPEAGRRGLTASDAKGGHWWSARHLEPSQLLTAEAPGLRDSGSARNRKYDAGSRDILGSLLHVHDEDSMDTSTLQMALIGYQAERHKIEEKIAKIRAQLNGRSWRSRQASSSFSKADPGMPRANLDPDIAALPISRQAKYQQQWKRDGRCIQCGKQRHLDSAMHCSGCRAKHRLEVRERERRLSNAKRRNLGSVSYRESGAVT